MSSRHNRLGDRLVEAFGLKETQRVLRSVSKDDLLAYELREHVESLFYHRREVAYDGMMVLVCYDDKMRPVVHKTCPEEELDIEVDYWTNWYAVEHMTAAEYYNRQKDPGHLDIYSEGEMFEKFLLTNENIWVKIENDRGTTGSTIDVSPRPPRAPALTADQLLRRICLYERGRLEGS